MTHNRYISVIIRELLKTLDDQVAMVHVAYETGSGIITSMECTGSPLAKLGTRNFKRRILTANSLIKDLQLFGFQLSDRNPKPGYHIRYRNILCGTLWQTTAALKTST